MLRKAKPTSHRRRIESEANTATRDDLAVTATSDSDRAINPIKHVDRRLAQPRRSKKSLCILRIPSVVVWQPVAGK